MITPGDITGVSEDVARRVIAVARSIVPCLDSLEGEPKADAIAILKLVAQEGRARNLKAQRVGPASADYFSADSFTDEDRAALRALCSGTVPAGLPIGSFPKPGLVTGLWPEVEHKST